jgi:organic anion transporter 5A
MDGQMDWRMDGWMVGWMDGWMVGWVDGWLDGRMDGRTDDGWKSGEWLDRWVAVWLDGWMHMYAWTRACMHVVFPRQSPTCYPQNHLYIVRPRTWSKTTGAQFKGGVNKVGRLIFFFGGSGVWTQSLTLSRQALHHLSHMPSPLCSSYFSGRISSFLSEQAYTVSLLLMLPG